MVALEDVMVFGEPVVGPIRIWRNCGRVKHETVTDLKEK